MATQIKFNSVSVNMEKFCFFNGKGVENEKKALVMSPYLSSRARVFFSFMGGWISMFLNIWVPVVTRTFLAWNWSVLVVTLTILSSSMATTSWESLRFFFPACLSNVSTILVLPPLTW